MPRRLLQGLVLIAVAGVVVTLGLSALLAPWNFYFGVTSTLFRLAGVGPAALPLRRGGDYSLWIRLNP